MHRRILVLCCLLLPLLAGCSSLGAYSQAPRVSLVDVRPLEMGLFEQRYRLKLRIRNPNAAALPVSGMDYTLYINGREFADGVDSQAFSVPAYGEMVIEVAVSSSLLDVVQQLQQRESRQALSWRLAGGLRVPGHLGRLPFEYAGRLDLAPAPAPAGGT